MTVTKREALLNSGLILLLISAIFFFMGVYLSGAGSLFMALRTGDASVLLFAATVSAILGFYCWVKTSVIKDE
jgi:hypothetical protein